MLGTLTNSSTPDQEDNHGEVLLRVDAPSHRRDDRHPLAPMARADRADDRLARRVAGIRVCDRLGALPARPDHHATLARSRRSGSAGDSTAARPWADAARLSRTSPWGALIRSPAANRAISCRGLSLCTPRAGTQRDRFVHPPTWRR